MMRGLQRHTPARPRAACLEPNIALAPSYAGWYCTTGMLRTIRGGGLVLLGKHRNNKMEQPLEGNGSEAVLSPIFSRVGRTVTRERGPVALHAMHVSPNLIKWVLEKRLPKRRYVLVVYKFGRAYVRSESFSGLICQCSCILLTFTTCAIP